MSTKFKVKDHVGLREIEGLPYVLQLMMNFDAIRASVRWLDHASKDRSVSGNVDRIIAMSAGMGWCGEAFRLLKQGANNGHITEEMLGDSAPERQLWTDVFSDPAPPLIRKFQRVRDKYFGHWDPELARQFVELQARGEHPEPFVESDGEGQFLKTRYRWAQAAFFHDLVDDPNNIDQVSSLIQDIGQTLARTANLLSKVIAGWVECSPLEFEPVDEHDSTKDSPGDSDTPSGPSSEQQMQIVGASGTLDFWDRPEEDVYSLDDGEPV